MDYGLCTATSSNMATTPAQAALPPPSLPPLPLTTRPPPLACKCDMGWLLFYNYFANNSQSVTGTTVATLPPSTVMSTPNK